MDNLSEIIEALKNIRGETKTKVSDEILFEQAVKIYISDKIGKQQSERFNMQGNKLSILPPSKNTKPSPATQKQIYFLKTQGIKIQPNLTKQEAQEMIKEIKDGERF